MSPHKVIYMEKPHAKHAPVKPKLYSLPTIEEIYLLGTTPALMPDERALFYLLYLSGGRVSEVLSIRKRDLTIKEAGLDEVSVILLPTLKTRQQQIVREIPIGSSETELAMLKEIEAYAAPKHPEDKLFDWGRHGRKRAWRVLHKLSTGVQATHPVTREIITIDEYKLYPHFLRHARLTHLAQQYGFNAVELMKFAGWSTPSLASTYINTDWKLFYKKMRSG